MAWSLADLFDNMPMIDVVDIGASPVDGPPPYQSLLERGGVRLVGFEPDETQYRELAARQSPNEEYYPLAIGDGDDATLHVCRAPGMTSLLSPDMDVLSHFAGFPEWGEVVAKRQISTKRLDDVEELTNVDYLKLDVQGSELAILQNATRILQTTLVVHIEVQFVPFYVNQPLFPELDVQLRESGFLLHRFVNLNSRLLRPMMVVGNPYAGMSQILWSDAVYVKRFLDFSQLESNELWKIALLAHDLYESFDLANLALATLDDRDTGDRSLRYVSRIDTTI
jgi:FkbM family methyltransferase